VGGRAPDDLAAAAALGGEMGRRVMAFDWASHPLGPLDQWPAPVRAVVATVLSSRFPVVVWLGEPLFLVYNDGYIPMLGTRHPSALGRPGHEVWWDIWDVVGPMLAGVVETGVATWSDDLHLNLVTGGHPEERYFTFTYSPIITDDGRVGVFCPVTETTARVLSERRLYFLNSLAGALMDAQTEEQVLQSTLDVVSAQHAVDVPAVAVYLDGATPDVRELRGATAGAHGRAPRSVAVDASGEPKVVEDDDGRAVEVGAASASLWLGLNPLRPFDEQYRSFARLLAGQVSAAFENARAYQFERQRAETLAALDQAKTMFLTNVSHEFRTPLTLLLAPLEDALEAGKRLDADVRDLVTTAYRNGLRLSRLVESLLDFSRVEAGETKPRLVEADVGGLTAQIASSFADVCARAGIDLVLKCSPVTAQVDPDMWETIVLNLVSNAFKFTLDGSITVEVEQQAPSSISVRVRDTGVGIDADELPRLFDRFYRASPTGARSVEGSGIGLALVRSLVTAHGGSVGIESESGAGTTVTVTLPASRTGPVERPLVVASRSTAYVSEALQWISDGTAGSRREGTRPLILIADDNADMRRHLERVLSPYWDTVAVGDGEAALEHARRLRPDLLLTDVMMPTLDGFGLVAAVRNDPALASLPVVMLSARAGLESSGEGLAIGADDYLVKPFSSSDLVSRVAARFAATERARAGGARGAAAMADLGASLAAAGTLEEVLLAVLASPAGSAGASAAAIATVERDAGLARVRYAGSLPAELAARYHAVALDAPIPIIDAISTGLPMVVTDTAELDARYRTVVADAAPLVQACVIEPLTTVEGVVIGAISFNWPEPRQFGAEELAALHRTAELVSGATERIRLAEREHRVATELQERLLDLDARSLTAVVSAAYQPATETMRVGGDWYTVTTLDSSGRLGVSVGDVVGSGLPAATVMSQLRSALGAVALSAAAPSAVLDLVERYAESIDGAVCATVAYAVVDGSAGEVAYACAGHPYPLVVGPDGTVSFLRDGRRPPLAAHGSVPAAPSGTSGFPAGSMLLLYTDGLVERRDEPLDAGLDRLAAAASHCAGLAAGAACEELLRRMAPPEGYSDDVALVAVRPVGTTGAAHVDVRPARLAEARGIRHRLRAWAEGLGLDHDRVHDVLLAVGEAVTNAVEHGSDGDPGRTVSLEAFVSGGELTASVSDSGRWASDSSASRRAEVRGHGLTLIHGLADSVAVARTVVGTRVTMTFRLALDHAI